MHSYEEHNPNLAERVARDSDFGFSGSKCYRKSTWHIRKGADNLLCSDAKDDCKTIKEEGKCSQNVGGCAGTPAATHSPPLPLALLMRYQTLKMLFLRMIDLLRLQVSIAIHQQ